MQMAKEESSTTNVEKDSEYQAPMDTYCSETSYENMIMCDNTYCTSKCHFDCLCCPHKVVLPIMLKTSKAPKTIIRKKITPKTVNIPCTLFIHTLLCILILAFIIAQAQNYIITF